MAGPSWGSLYEGSYHFRSMSGAPDFWKLSYADVGPSLPHNSHTLAS